MGMFDEVFVPVGGADAQWWNGKNPSKPGYSKTLNGVVVETHERYAMFKGEYQKTAKGAFKEELVLTIQDSNGQEWKTSFGKYSSQYNAIIAAVQEAGLPHKISEIAGRDITIECLGLMPGNSVIRNAHYEYKAVVGDRHEDMYRGHSENFEVKQTEKEQKQNAYAEWDAQQRREREANTPTVEEMVKQINDMPDPDARMMMAKAYASAHPEAAEALGFAPAAPAAGQTGSVYDEDVPF